MLRRAIVASSLVVAAAGCGDNAVFDPCAGRDGNVHACGSQLRDADGRALILRGVNFAGAHKYAPYTDTFGPDDYAQLHAWGFRSTRFLFPWSAVEPTQGVYDDSYLDFVAQHARWAREAGLSVILDMHQDVYGVGFGFDGAPLWTCSQDHYDAFVPNDQWLLNYNDPNVIACFDHLFTDDDLQASYAAMWAHVAAYLANEPAIIGFDPMNEPFWGSYAVGSFEPDRLEPLYLRVIDAIREHAPWIAFAEPASSRNLGFATALHPFDRPDVVYAPHLYDSSAELTGTFDVTHRDSLMSTATDLRGEADRLGVPMWIGEYGGIATSDYITPYMDAEYDGAAANLSGSMYWSLDRGGGYSLLDDDGTPRDTLVDAVARPYPSRIAGDPMAWTYDDTARVLDVTWHPDAAIAAPTVIVVPDRAYPTGLEVSCGGCTVAMGDGEILLSEVAGDPAHVTITPR